MGLKIAEDIPGALKDVRNDKSDTNFAVVTFAADDDAALVLAGKGSTGVEGAKELMNNDDIFYALVRDESEYEKVGRLSTVGTRFVFLYLRPESIPLKRKKIIGVSEGQVKKLFSPFAHAWEVAIVDEVSEAKLKDIIEEISMKKNHVNTGGGASALFIGGRAVKEISFRSEKKQVVQGEKRLTVPDEVPEALKDVRKETSKINFAVVGFDDESPTTFALLGKGEDGIEGIKTFIKEDDICYCLLKVDFTYEKAGVITSNGTRFMFIIYRPDDLPISRKKVIGPLEGEIKHVFAPYITNLEISKVEDLTEEVINKEVDRITMKKNNVSSNAGNAANTLYFGGAIIKKEEKRPPRKFVGGMTGATQALSIIDEDKFKEAIAAVRKDSDETTFAIAEFVGDKKKMELELVSTGTGGLDELSGKLANDKVQYALIRSEEVVDGRSPRTKFTLIQVQPSGVSFAILGVIGVLHGATLSAFGQHHKLVRCGSPEEVSSIKL